MSDRQLETTVVPFEAGDGRPLDQAAVHDHPLAVRTVLDRTGADTLQAVVHCQGSTSFTMAAVAGLLPESQQRSFHFFDSVQPNRHALHLLPGYGHLDVFLGRRAASDVFPIILEELQ